MQSKCTHHGFFLTHFNVITWPSPVTSLISIRSVKRNLVCIVCSDTGEKQTKHRIHIQQRKRKHVGRKWHNYWNDRQQEGKMDSRAYPKLQLGLYIKLLSQLMHSSITAHALTHQRHVTGTRTTAPAPMPTYVPPPWSVVQIPTITTQTLAAIMSTTKWQQITLQASNQPSPVTQGGRVTSHPMDVCTIWKQKCNIAPYQYSFPLWHT